jgi:hypothetical protein
MLSQFPQALELPSFWDVQEELFIWPIHEPYPFAFTDGWHPTNRSDRFPSVEERVKLYMSNWYLPPCNDDNKLTHRIELVEEWPRAFVSKGNASLEIDSVVHADRLFLLHNDAIRDCARTIPEVEAGGPLKTESRIFQRNNLQSYCSEVVSLLDYMSAFDLFTPEEFRNPTPVFGQFGDKLPVLAEPNIPVIGKWREATTLPVGESTASCVTKRVPLKATMYKGFSPIIWKLEMCRHWDPLEEARRQDVPWDKKKLGALWRGDFTGVQIGGTDEMLCMNNQRCRFVLHHAHSKLIDAGLTDGLDFIKSETINGLQVLRDRVTMNQIQQNKVIISMEGNDVASGLKWSLLSESVVVMPPPTRTSWAMEELLEPWIHYIPMNPDGSNAEERIKWVGENDEAAHRIAERGRLFIYDHLYHPDASRDEQKVKEEIARRYRQLWQ